MNKKKIAVFATGWSPEIIESYINGMIDGFKKDNVDLYLFLNYALTTSKDYIITGELNIYNLPDLNDFDGAVIIGNGLDFSGLFEEITLRCKNANIPAVCTGRKPENGAYFVGSDNRVGARELYEHIVNDHNCTDVVFIAGSADNPDSNTRLNVLRECLEAKGYSLPDSRICYTDWLPGEAAEYVSNWHLSGRKMPQAFICANDTLAMPVCDVLRNSGYKVPDDLIVTGYDYEFFCRIYDPAITSVNQCFDKIGMESASLLLDLIAGIKRPRRMLVPSRFVKSESCGCFMESDANDDRRVACKAFFHNNMKQSMFTSQLAMMETTLMEGKSVEEFGRNFAEYMKNHSNRYEGNTFHLLLEPSYAQSIIDPNTVFNTTKYSDILNVVVTMDNGHISYNETMEKNKLVPFISDEIKENRFFVFLPIHEREKNYGYIVFGDDVSKISDYNYLNSYILRISTILEMYRQRLSMNFMNVKLMEYSATDALTHVKNRAAYEEMEKKLTNEIMKDIDYQFGIMMFDINNLKKINDELGHEYGDQYIVGSCMLICNIYKCSPVYRIGGDEFVCVLTGTDYERRDDLMLELQRSMKELQIKDIPFHEKYSVACGMAVYNPDVDSSVSDVFNRADDAMYENKVAMKACR